MISFFVILMTLFIQTLLRFMQNEFEMSMMEELKFFLGIQINQGTNE